MAEEIDLDAINATVINTGIAPEKIDLHLSATCSSNEWRCTYDEAGKTCDQLFECTEDARSHVQNHKGDRKFRCNECGKTFTRLQHMKRHGLRHGTDRPHGCPCGRKFTRHDLLVRHRQTVHHNGAETFSRTSGTKWPYQNHENVYGSQSFEASVFGSPIHARGRTASPVSSRRGSSTSSVRSTIDDLQVEAHRQRSRTRAVSPPVPASPFRYRSAFDDEYREFSRTQPPVLPLPSRYMPEPECSGESLVHECCPKRDPGHEDLRILEAMTHNRADGRIEDVKVLQLPLLGPLGELSGPQHNNPEWQSQVWSVPSWREIDFTRSHSQKTPSPDPPYMRPASSQNRSQYLDRGPEFETLDHGSELADVGRPPMTLSVEQAPTDHSCQRPSQAHVELRHLQQAF